jgi:hypothetical protein
VNQERNDRRLTRRTTGSWPARVRDNTLVNASWQIVSPSGSTSAASYALALRMAEEACRIAPDDGLFLTVLGAAQYRAGKDHEAIETLSRASRLAGWVTRRAESPTLGFLGDQFRTLTRNGQNAQGLAFLVMAHARAGQNAEARTELEVLRGLIESLQIPSGSSGLQFVSEAEALGPKLMSPSDPAGK